MKFSYQLFVALALFGMVSSAPAEAQTSIPIQQLQEREGIAISGRVTSVVGNEFILDDGTGQIIVDAGPRWWHQIEISAGEWLTVTGEMDNNDFDAFTITRENEETIPIRPAQGPPPWAGGRRRQNTR